MLKNKKKGSKKYKNFKNKKNNHLKMDKCLMKKSFKNKVKAKECSNVKFQKLKKMKYM